MRLYSQVHLPDDSVSGLDVFASCIAVGGCGDSHSLCTGEGHMFSIALPLQTLQHLDHHGQGLQDPSFVDKGRTIAAYAHLREFL